MSTEITRKETAQLLYNDKSIDHLVTVDKFNVLLNQPPPAKWIKKNKYANNAAYLPIDKVEYLLKKIFKRYKVEVLRENTMFNAVYVAIRLHYFNPVLNEWEWQDGVGASQISTESGASPADLSKIKNLAVEQALPKAKSNATKDAAHNIGRIFGADLNRNEVIPVNPDSDLYDRQFQKEKERVLALIKDGQHVSDEVKKQYGI